MWVRLKAIQRGYRQGKLVPYRPGDWNDVGKQTALLWLSRGDAEIPTFRNSSLVAGEAGVVIRAPSVEPYQAQFSLTKLDLLLSVGEPCLAFQKTLIWEPGLLLRVELIGAGFGMLDTWEVAAPLYSYDELAVHIGTDEERARTQAVVRDLRIPLYDTRLIFARNCENAKRLFDAWTNEREGSTDERHAFMRAFYKVKPLMLALPATWHTPNLYASVA
jgi:hypothetical protein